MSEAYCDILNHIPTEKLNFIFGDKTKEFLQLKILNSKVNAKMVLFEKLQRNQTKVPSPAPTYTPTFPHAYKPTFPPASTSESTFEENLRDALDDEDDDLNAFLRLNEEERDSWGKTNNVRSTDCNGKYIIYGSVRRRELISW